MESITFPRGQGAIEVKLTGDGWTFTRHLPKREPDPASEEDLENLSPVEQAMIKMAQQAYGYNPNPEPVEVRVAFDQLLGALTYEETQLLLGYMQHTVDQARTHLDFMVQALNEAHANKDMEAIHEQVIEIHDLIHMIELADESARIVLELEPTTG